MRQATPNTMQAAAIDRFGGIETIALRNTARTRGRAG